LVDFAEDVRQKCWSISSHITSKSIIRDLSSVFCVRRLPSVQTSYNLRTRNFSTLLPICRRRDSDGFVWNITCKYSLKKAQKTVGSLFIITIGRIGDTQHNGRLVVVLRLSCHAFTKHKNIH